MVNSRKYPFYREDDNERLGFIVDDGLSWQALTIFGAQISRTETRKEAEDILKDKGLSYLLGTWQYFDKDDRDWFPCVIKEAYEHKVIVNRTNTLGYQDPDDYKQVVLENPTENDLIKSANNFLTSLSIILSNSSKMNRNFELEKLPISLIISNEKVVEF